MVAVHGARATVIVLSVAGLMAGCASGDTSSPVVNSSTPVSSAPLAPDGVSGELIITRQRDLLDRGLINVLTRNDSGTSLLVADLELVVDHFDGEPAASRTISVRDGRQVAIQVPYGVADECDSDNPVGAALTFTYTTDIDPEPKHAAIQLDGTDLLDEIRTEQCTTRTFDDAVTARFVNTAIVGGAVVTDLVLEPTGTAAGLVVTGASGTILMGVRVGEQWAGASIDDAPVVIPLRFVVNRCDPHALAEVTKRYGLDVAVSADGAEPVTVAVDVADLVADFETVVEQCTISAAADD